MRFRPTSSLIFIAILLLSTAPLFAATHAYRDAWGDPGLRVAREDATGLELHFSLASWELGEIEIEGRTLRTIQVPGIVLPNDAGAPNLPGMSRYIAVPNGATVSIEIVASRTETLTDIDLAPAPRLPKETEDGPLEYPRNEAIYSSNAPYPAEPVILSPMRSVRGVAATILGITPFQYNPVSRELVVYRDLRIRVSFEGGTGQFGEDRLRSRWWEPILADLFINYGSIGAVDRRAPSRSRTPDYEYVILCPDDPSFLAWADSLGAWRSAQGIRTGVVTTAEIGGNSASAIEAYLNDAYNNWDIPPSAALLLGDYGSSATTITSPVYNNYCISDNLFADVDGDHLPDITLARITARDEAELSTMIGKMLGYERQPPVDPLFYDNPIMAGGWQTERWFILCEEVLTGFLTNALGKAPVREYAIYEGTPGSIWSTAPNTSTVVGYFGPSGLGYIPNTPSYLTDWGGNATRINTDVNRGAFLLQHRDHGSTDGWGEPSYGISNLSGLSNDKLTFVFSINCLTGQFNLAGQCFAEAFHRHLQGALGLLAATEISYSFVNDAFVWGVYDFMWPDFDPGYGIAGPVNLRPAFANASGKYYLEASSWPYNTADKQVTYYLFHHHGDAFLALYSEIPESLTVAHDASLAGGIDFFPVTANAGSWIGLSSAGEYLGAGAGTGTPVNITIPPQDPGATIVVTVTKQNYYRYEANVPVVSPEGPFVVYESHTIDDSDGDGDGVADEGETVAVAVTVSNLGSETAKHVSAMLSTADPYVGVIDSVEDYPNIPPGGSATSSAPFRLSAAGDTPDGNEASFTLSVDAGGSIRDSYFSMVIEAPALVADGLLIDDIAGGNGDGNANPGETLGFDLLLFNAGHSDADDLSAILSTADTNVTILGSGGDCANVPVAGQSMLGTFQAALSPACPEPSNVPFHLDITGTNGFVAALDFDMPVGGWYDDMEKDRGWTVGAPGDDATAGIWERVDPIGTSYNGHTIQMEDDHTFAPGVMCFVTGNGTVGGTAGENDVDGGKTTLSTPVFDLTDATAATVAYWRWYTNAWGNNPDSDWWNVDATDDGEVWIGLEQTQQTNASWVEQSFSLTDYVTLTDQVRLRFVASDESGGSLVEAGVDDFLMAAIWVVYTGVEESPDRAPAKLVLRRNSPNPFNPRTTIGFDLPRRGSVELAVYDVSGRRVATLMRGELEAGHHEAVWMGDGEDGEPVASGLYFSRIEAGGEVRTGKMILLK